MKGVHDFVQHCPTEARHQSRADGVRLVRRPHLVIMIRKSRDRVTLLAKGNASAVEAALVHIVRVYLRRLLQEGVLSYIRRRCYTEIATSDLSKL